MTLIARRSLLIALAAAPAAYSSGAHAVDAFVLRLLRPT